MHQFSPIDLMQLRMCRRFLLGWIGRIHHVAISSDGALALQN